MNAVPTLTNIPSSPEWHKYLSSLQSLTSQLLQIDRLILFELSTDPGQSDRLLVRAATCEIDRAAIVPVSDHALALLKQSDHSPIVLDVTAPSGPLAPLTALIAGMGCKAALVRGFQQENRLLGCLVGCLLEHRSFSSADLSTFSLCASSLSSWLENVRLQTETAFHLSEVMSLQAVSSALVEEQSLDAILGMIIDEAIRLLDANEALVLLLEENGERFQVRARKGAGVAELASGRMSVKESLNGLVIESGQPLVSNDVLADPRSNFDRAKRLGVRTVAIAPLRIRSKTIGTVAVHNKRDGYFGQTDVKVLCSFANQAAIAIDNARLFGELLNARNKVQQYAGELQELCFRTMHVQEEERRRIASDVHDQIISRIVGALYQVEACIQLNQHSQALDGHLHSMRRLLDAAVSDMRQSIYNLWPATLDQIGLISALRELASRREQDTGVPHSIRLQGAPTELLPAARIAVYRIVQEALNNTQQHASASMVEITIRYSAQGLSVVIRDDGEGFDLQHLLNAPPVRHFGIIGMRERALSISGDLSVNSVPDQGCRVVLKVPTTQFQSQREQENAKNPADAG